MHVGGPLRPPQQPQTPWEAPLPWGFSRNSRHPRGLRYSTCPAHFQDPLEATSATQNAPDTSSTPDIRAARLRAQHGSIMPRPPTPPLRNYVFRPVGGRFQLRPLWPRYTFWGDALKHLGDSRQSGRSKAREGAFGGRNGVGSSLRSHTPSK